MRMFPVRFRASIASVGRATALVWCGAVAATAESLSEWRARPGWDRFTSIILWAIFGLVVVVMLGLVGLIT